MCHQASRAGNPPAIPSLIGVVPRLGKARVREVVANGIPGGTPQMPSFGGRLSQAEISDLIAYLQSTK
jgi:quinoprotein glucose dehydrogenase